MLAQRHTLLKVNFECGSKDVDEKTRASGLQYDTNNYRPPVQLPPFPGQWPVTSNNGSTEPSSAASFHPRLDHSIGSTDLAGYGINFLGAIMRAESELLQQIQEVRSGSKEITEVNPAVFERVMELYEEATALRKLEIAALDLEIANGKNMIAQSMLNEEGLLWYQGRVFEMILQKESLEKKIESQELELMKPEKVSQALSFALEF
ncbi:hypothetical protein BC939DRAFT_514796 [Gamsiella multidivaricata]|uniref:uncharacterized protein n=1 Tax=Gamsiella multidivaricata TaxID=101098 RepID=UPI00222090A0|nr:uncharacterized protein BC939DRAFT_514796 [Gamsiella multidivaricata]KAI7826046.1 hypothetical protein BC939DRAFT_514796 [Gamsiella multidivaricata]